MATNADDSAFAKAVCDALGLKEVRRLEIIFAIDTPVTVIAEFYPDGIEALIKKFHLTATALPES